MGSRIIAILFQNETLNSESGSWAVFDFRPTASGKRLVAFRGIAPEHRDGDQLIKAFRQTTENDRKSARLRSLCYIENTNVAEKYLKKYGGKAITFIEIRSAEMDRVAKCSSKIRSSDGRYKRHLSKDDVVVFERDLGENFQTFIERDGTVNSNCCGKLQEFVHFVYNESKGHEIVTGLKGVVTKQGQKFKLTSPSMNSIVKKYGPDDIGEKAILNFFSSHVCTPVCSQWPKPVLMNPFNRLETDNKPQNSKTSTDTIRCQDGIRPPAYDSKWRVDFEKLGTLPLLPTAPPPYDQIT